MDKSIKQLSDSITSVNASDLLEIQRQSETVTKKITVDNLTKLEQTARAAADNAIIAGAGLASDGSCAFSGTHYLDAKTKLKTAIETLDTRIYSTAQQITQSPLSAIEITVSALELGQLNTFPVTLLEFAAPAAGVTRVFMIQSAMLILYQDGNPMVYGEEAYIGYDTGGDPAVSAANRIFKIPQTFLEDSSGNNVICIPEYLPGAGAKSGVSEADVVLWTPSSNHTGLTLTSTAKVILVYKSITITEATGGGA